MKKLSFLFFAFLMASCNNSKYEDYLSRAVNCAQSVHSVCWVTMEMIKQGASTEEGEFSVWALNDNSKDIAEGLDSLDFYVSALKEIGKDEPSLKDITFIHEKCKVLSEQYEKRDILGLDTLVFLVDGKLKSIRKKYNIPYPEEE